MNALKNDFYTIKESSVIGANQTLTVVHLNVDHDIYKGHFPEMPVVPGVCQLQMIKELLEGHLGKKLLTVTGDNIKFTGMIVPPQNAIINIEMTHTLKDAGIISVDARLFFEGTTFTKFKGTFKAQ